MKKERKYVTNRYGKTVEKSRSESAYDSAMSRDDEEADRVCGIGRTESDRISEGFEMLGMAGDD